MPRIAFWVNRTPLQRRAILLIGVSLLVGFFLSRRTAPLIEPSATAWREFYTTSSPTFRIAMPIYPRHLVQDVPLPLLGITVRKGLFVSEDNEGRTYTLAVATYPSRMPPFVTNTIVEAELQALFQNTSDYHMNMSANENGADFSATRFDGGPSIKGKVVVDGQTVYVLSFSAPPSRASDNLYQQFVSSFQR